MFSLTDLESQIYIFAFPMRKHAQLLITSFPLDYDSWHLVLLFLLRRDLNCSPALWRRQSVTSSYMEISQSISIQCPHTGGELWGHRILCCPQTSALTLTCYSCVLDFHFLLYISFALTFDTRCFGHFPIHHIYCTVNEARHQLSAVSNILNILLHPSFMSSGTSFTIFLFIFLLWWHKGLAAVMCFKWVSQ